MFHQKDRILYSGIFHIFRKRASHILLKHPFHIHSAVATSSVAILAHRSMINGGMPYDIPDFYLEECRKQYENDRLSPFLGADGSAPTLPCCSHTDHKGTDEKPLDQLIADRGGLYRNGI